MADVETKTVPPKKMKETASMDLSDPSQLTMKEIIRRAEAIERAVCFCKLSGNGFIMGCGVNFPVADQVLSNMHFLGHWFKQMT